jgi:ATP-dependent Clp protease ATP-binding subunit ClpA
LCVFERFTQQARQVIVLAQEEARGLRHTYIGTEHVLLGLGREQEGLAAQVLEALGITESRVREDVWSSPGLQHPDSITPGVDPPVHRTGGTPRNRLQPVVSLLVCL